MSVQSSAFCGPVHNGFAGIQLGTDVYCLDCAGIVLDTYDSILYETGTNEWKTSDDFSGKDVVTQLVSGTILRLSEGEAIPKSDSEQSIHCGRGSACLNSIPSDMHEYTHSIDIGVELQI